MLGLKTNVSSCWRREGLTIRSKRNWRADLNIIQLPQPSYPLQTTRQICHCSYCTIYSHSLCLYSYSCVSTLIIKLIFQRFPTKQHKNLPQLQVWMWTLRNCARVICAQVVMSQIQCLLNTENNGNNKKRSCAYNYQHCLMWVKTFAWKEIPFFLTHLILMLQCFFVEAIFIYYCCHRWNASILKELSSSTGTARYYTIKVYQNLNHKSHVSTSPIAQTVHVRMHLYLFGFLVFFPLLFTIWRHLQAKPIKFLIF